MDAFSWLTDRRTWAAAALLAAIGFAPTVDADQQVASSSTIVLVGDQLDDAETHAAESVPAAQDANPGQPAIQWSASAEPTAEPAPPTQVAVVDDGSAAEPLRAVRPTFITDSQVVPASLYGSGASFAGPQQPLRRTTTLQLRAQPSGRSLADRLSGIGQRRDNAPEQADAAPRIAAQGAAKHEDRRAQALQRARAAGANQSQATDAAAVRLIQAHEISLAATTEGEYSQIITLCSEAVHSGVEGDQRQFATQLAAWALNRRGEARTDDGHDELAMADFRAALQYDPNHWRTLHNRAVTFAQQGKFAEAFDDVSRVIELAPDYAKAYANRGTLFVQAGDLESAVADYTRAIDLDANLTAALVGRARVRHMLGDWEAAVQDFDAAIASGGGGAAVHCSRGDLQADLGRYGDALADYAEAIELDESCAHAYRNGSWLLATCPDPSFRDPENAILGAEQALKCGYGDRHAALDALAAALANAGQFDKAVVTEQQAIDVAPAELREGYSFRLQLYEANEPYRTSPVVE